jgi:hypothetical protein
MPLSVKAWAPARGLTVSAEGIQIAQSTVEALSVWELDRKCIEVCPAGYLEAAAY